MEKTTTLNLRVNPENKRNAEAVLSQLGMPMSTAIDIYLRQISLTGGIPFPIKLPKIPAAVNAEAMSAAGIHTEIREGIADMEAGNVQDASEAFRQFRTMH